jgi:serine protease AprX
MASPHVAGAVAVLLQANPRLTPEEVRLALQVTATPVHGTAADGTTPTADVLPFWEVGYGAVDLAAAAELVQARRFGAIATERQKRLDEQVERAEGLEVRRSDFATWAAPPATVGTDDRTFELPLDRRTTHVGVTLAFPSTAVIGADIGLTTYSVVVRDASGAVIAEGAPVGLGAIGALVDLRTLDHAVAGPLQVQVVGDLDVSDPDTLDSDSVLGDTVTLQVVQLRAVR